MSDAFDVSEARAELAKYGLREAGGGKVPPVDRSGRGRDDDDMERIARLEADVKHLQSDLSDVKVELREVRKDINGIRTTDFRILFGATIAVALGLATMMARGFHWF